MKQDIYCNKCGKRMDEFDILYGMSCLKPLGYGSKYDGEHILMNLCIDCLDELIDECIFSPILETN